SVIDGETGSVVSRVPWPSRDDIGTSYNQRSRNQIGVAYLDGKTPFIIAARGTYGVMLANAAQYTNNTITVVREWNSSNEVDYDPNGKLWYKQESHSMRTGDVDGDGLDEVVLGAAVLDDNLTGKWAVPGSSAAHPDHTYLGDLDPL